MDVLVDGEIVLYGTVGDDLFGEGFTGRDVVDALAEIGRGTDVTVRLNSGGGYATEGSAIYNALRAHRGKVTVYVDSIAASAASLIAMAGSEIVMRRGAVMMIHDPSMITIGDAATHEKSLESLHTLADSFADIYAERSGKTIEDARADMQAERWLTAADAVAEGYATRLDKEAPAVKPTMFDYRLYRHAPAPLMAEAKVLGPQRAKMTAASAATTRQQETSMANERPADTTPATVTTMQDTLQQIDEAVAVALRADRSRAHAIVSAPEAEGRRGLAEHLAYHTEMTVDQAKAALSAAPKEPAKSEAKTGFEALMASLGNPQVGPDDAGQAQSAESKPGAMAASMRRLIGKPAH